MNELIIEKRWIEINNFKKAWLISTSIGFFIYIFFILIFNWSYSNYLLISLQISIQLFFALSTLKEKLIINSEYAIYQFLFIKKTCKIDYFIVQDCEADNEETFRKEFDYYRIVLYEKNKKKLSINDIYWKNHYKSILYFLRNNFEEYELNEIHNQKDSDNLPLTICFIIALFTLIFGVGLLSENTQKEYVTDLVSIEGHIKYQPKAIKHVGKSGTYYTIPFILEEFPNYNFILGEKGIKKIDGHQFIQSNKVGAKIKFILDKRKYDESIAKTQPLKYFNAQITLDKQLSIMGIYFDNKQLLNEEMYIKNLTNNNFEFAILIVVSSFIFFAFSIYYMLRICSPKDYLF